MSKFLGEHADLKVAFITGSSTITSQPFSLRDVSRVSVLCALNDTLSSVLATSALGATFGVVVGTAAEVSAMTALTGATLVLGQTTVGACNNMETVCISAHGTLATGRSLVIDNTTFMIEANATLTDKQLSASACSVFTAKLASAIATYCTHLETFGRVTNGNATATSLLYVRRKDYGSGMPQSFNVNVTANAASSDGVYIQPIKAQGVIEFRPADVLSTNSSYTHFGIKMQSSGAHEASVSVIRVTGYHTTNVNRVKV